MSIRRVLAGTAGVALVATDRPDGAGPPVASAFDTSGGTVPGMLEWMPSSSGGASAPMTSVIWAPQSPPWATPRRPPTGTSATYLDQDAPW